MLFLLVVTGNICEYLISTILEHVSGLIFIPFLFFQLTILGLQDYNIGNTPFAAFPSLVSPDTVFYVSYYLFEYP